MQKPSCRSGWIPLTIRCALLFVATIPFLQAAEDSEQAQQELAAVEESIATIQAWMSDALENESSEVESLRQAELQLSTLIQSVTGIETAIADTQSQIALLSRRAENLEAQKNEQNDVLEKLIRSIYMAGNPSAIEFLLNQEDLSKSARLLHYNKLISEAQLATIADFQSTLDELASVNSELQSEAANLNRDQIDLNSELEKLSLSKQRREAALAQLRSDIVARSAELEQLATNQAQLQALIEEINRAVADIPAAMRRMPFAQERGKLQLPVAGQIRSEFGARYGEGDLRRQGITIQVSEGTPVQAIHPGRVVFSDWLRGTGLLVIIDHGEGYMSLYGANQALSKEAGDWVDRGEIIATSGLSDELGRTQENAAPSPGIYFEIRHHGEAQNPTQWLAN